MTTSLRAEIVSGRAARALAERCAATDAGPIANSLPWLDAAEQELGQALVHVALRDGERDLGHLALQRTRGDWRSGAPGMTVLRWPFANVGYGFRPRWLGAPDPAWLAALRTAFVGVRLELERTDAQAAPPAVAGFAVGPGVATWRLAVDGGVDAWRASLVGKHRRDLNKYRRDIERAGGEWLDVTTPSAAELDAVFALHRARLNSKGTARGAVAPAVERFLRTLVRSAGAAGTRLTLLRHGERFVAGALSFVHASTLTAFVSGWAASHARFDLGRQVLHHQVLQEFQRGLAAIDFLGGDLPYKREFGLVPAPTVDALAVAGALDALCGRVLGSARHGLRRLRSGARSAATVLRSGGRSS